MDLVVMQGPRKICLAIVLHHLAAEGTDHLVEFICHLPRRLLSPQHWSQIPKDDLPQPKVTWCATYDDSVVLEWQQRKYRRTVPLDPGTNVATFRSAPGYNHFKAFVSKLNNPHEELIVCDSRLVSDDEASDK